MEVEEWGDDDDGDGVNGGVRAAAAAFSSAGQW
jgi:hypothetical protein